MTISIWESIKTALAPLSVPMADNTYIVATGAALPDLFMVYLVVTTPPEQHADNKEISRTHHVQVSIYNRAGLSVLPDVAAAMVTAGFTKGPQREIPYNQDTMHFGVALDFYLLELE